MDMAAAIVVSVIAAATPLLFAALGELITEKAGVLNLGVEGMMLAGAVTAFAVAAGTGSLHLGILAGAGAGALLSLLFGLLTPEPGRQSSRDRAGADHLRHRAQRVDRSGLCRHAARRSAQA